AGEARRMAVTPGVRLVAIGPPLAPADDDAAAVASALAAAGVALDSRTIVEEDEHVLERALTPATALTVLLAGPGGSTGDGARRDPREGGRGARRGRAAGGRRARRGLLRPRRRVAGAGGRSASRCTGVDAGRGRILHRGARRPPPDRRSRVLGILRARRRRLF